MQDYMSWLWLGLTIVFVVVEACTSELVSVWFVAGSVAGLILSLFELPIGVQAAGFVAVALAALLAIRPLAMKRAKVEKTPTNADMVLGRLLKAASGAAEVRLVSAQGGSKDNAIPRSCQATVVAMGIGIERINDIAAQLQQEIRENFDEPEATVQAFDVDALGGNSLTTEDTSLVITLLCAAPNGVQSYSADIPGLVQTSLNLGIAKLGEMFSATFSVRSSVNREKQDVLDQLKKLCEFYDGNYSQRGEYPAWEYRKDSVLRETMVRIYTEMFGKEPKVLAIHAGLECGLLNEKLPGLDAVSIGPQMHDIHTSREKLEIASTARVWEFLCRVLKAL